MLLAVLAVLGIGFGVLAHVLPTPGSVAIAQERITHAALAEAKAALVGYAARDGNRPGSLPCPDLNDNGSAELFAGSDCPGYVGRLPWRTLGLPDPRDGGGERLWYAVSRSFARNPLGAPALNTDVPGQLTVTGASPMTGVVAIVFAPGLVVGSQVRNVPNKNITANYLEGGNEIGGTTIFTASTPSPVFNDQLLAITADALFRVVETRVAREARAALQSFYSANGFFPYANAYGDSSERCTTGQFTGRVPRFFTDQCKAAAADPDWKGVAWPAWFFGNGWHRVLFYAVAPKCAEPSFPGCASPSGALLTVSSPPPNSNIRALLITPGRALAGQTRPCVTVADCLEDPENTNGDSVFVNSAPTATTNDRLIVASP